MPDTVEQEIPVDRALAARVLEVVDAGLSHGMGEPVPGQMCIEAAVCYAMGLPHSDEPPCVARAVRRFKIGLNDQKWSSSKARARGLRRLAIAQLGTMGVVKDEDFDKAMLEMTRTEFLREERVLRAKTLSEALEKFRELSASGVNSANDARSFSIQTDALLEKVVSADGHLRRLDEFSDPVELVKTDAERSRLAELVVQVLVRLGSPGAQWLDLAPLPKAA